MEQEFDNENKVIDLETGEISKFEPIRELIRVNRENWIINEERAKELYDYIMNNIYIEGWEIYIEGHNKMSFADAMKLIKKMIFQSRFIEASDIMLKLLESLPSNIHILKNRLEDIFRSFLNIDEQKNYIIDTVTEVIDKTEDVSIRVNDENQKLKEENKRLKDMLEFSQQEYFEYWKIVNVKLENVYKKYELLSSFKDENELKSYLESLQIELKYGIKPIEEKLKYINKIQKQNFGISGFDFSKKVKKQKLKPNENKKDEEVDEVDEVDEELNNENFKDDVNRIKEDYIKSIEIDKDDSDMLDKDIVDESTNGIKTEKEIKKEDILKYTNFKVFSKDMYDESKYDAEQPLSNEEKEERKKLIMKKDEDEEYMLESEVDYKDISFGNKVRVMTLCKLDKEIIHEIIGVNSVNWKNRFLSDYITIYNSLKEKGFKKFGLSLEQKKHLKKFKDINL